MDISGIKKSLCIDITKILFGEIPSKFVESLITYGPCPLNFIHYQTKIPLTDLKTISLSMYSHGVLNIKGEGEKALISLSTFPLFILIAPYVFLDEVRSLYNKQEFIDVLEIYLLEGIISIESGYKYLSSEIEFPEEFFINITNELYKIGFLARSIKPYNSFSSSDVRSLKTRINNLQLIKKRSSNSSKNSNSQPIQNIINNQNEYDENIYCIDWEKVSQFLRSRFIVSYINKMLGKEFIPIVEQIIISSKCGNYSHLYRMHDHLDEVLRNEQIVLTQFSTQELSRSFNSLPSNVFLERIDVLSSNWLGFLSIASDGSSYEVQVPNVIRLLQLSYMNSFVEKEHSHVHRRIFTTLQNLKVADTRQLEDAALVSGKDSRISMYFLCKIGFAQLQGIPKTNDKNISQTIFVWRFDEEAAIKSYCNILGENARRMLSKINEYINLSESFENVDINDSTATITKEKCSRFSSGFHAYFSEIMKTFILFSEM